MACQHAYAHLLRAYPELNMSSQNFTTLCPFPHDLQPRPVYQRPLKYGGRGPAPLPPGPPQTLQPHEVDAVLDDYPDLQPEQRRTIHVLVKNAAGIQRVVILFQIISLAQAMCSANRIDRTVDAMITRIEGKVVTALSRITSVQGKGGATSDIDCVASIEDKTNSMMNMVQDQQHDTLHNWTAHREGYLKLDKLNDSLLVVAKDCIAQPHCSNYVNFEDHLFSYARTHTALLDIENIFGHPALMAKVLVICSQIASHALDMAQDKILSSITPGPTAKPLMGFVIEFTSVFLRKGTPSPLSSEYIYHCACLRKFARMHSVGCFCTTASIPSRSDGTAKIQDASPGDPNVPSTLGAQAGRRTGVSADTACPIASASASSSGAFWKHYGQELRCVRQLCPTQEVYVKRMEALVREDVERYGATPSC